jgi:uncharacterized membrane protein
MSVSEATSRALQAPPRRPAPPANVGEDERTLSALAGAGLVVAGLARRGVPGLVAGTAGAVLFARGASGRCAVYRALGISTADGAPQAPIEIARSITIDEGVEKLRDALHHPERWLAGGPIESVSPEGDRWRVAIRALGFELADVDVELRDDAPDTIRVFARQGEGTPHEGRVSLRAAPDGRGTELHVCFCVRPSGRLRAALVRAADGVARRALGHALQRLRQLVETGEIARTEGQPHGRRGLIARTLRAGTRREAAA